MYAITDMGSSYRCVILQDDLIVDKSFKKKYEKYAGEMRFALVFDPEYGDFSIRKWGFDLFTEKQWLKRGGNI